MSVRFSRPLNWNLARGVLTNYSDCQIADTRWQAAQFLFGDYGQIRAEWIQTAGPNDLEASCDSIVTDFDVEHLEVQRQDHQRRLDSEAQKRQ